MNVTGTRQRHQKNWESPDPLSGENCVNRKVRCEIFDISINN